ncbi:MAG: hypothetical protein ACYC60_20420, partial [Thermoanaerobaculia bacterium]
RSIAPPETSTSARTMPAQSFARVLAGRAKLFAWKDSRDVFRSRAAHCFAPTQVIQFIGSGRRTGCSIPQSGTQPVES